MDVGVLECSSVTVRFRSPLDDIVEVFHHAHTIPPEAQEVYLAPFRLYKLLEEEDVCLVSTHLLLEGFQGFALH